VLGFEPASPAGKRAPFPLRPTYSYYLLGMLRCSPAEAIVVINHVKQRLHGYNSISVGCVNRYLWSLPLDSNQPYECHKLACFATNTRQGKYLMRISEITDHILNETVQEERELQDIASYVAGILSKKPRRGPLTLEDLEDISGKRSPSVISPVVHSMLDGTSFYMFNDRDNPRHRGEYDTANSAIGLNVAGLIGKAKWTVRSKMESTLVHELRHALDYYKSRTKALPPRPQMGDDVTGDQYDEYVRYHEEINARFSQALMDMSKAKIDPRFLEHEIKEIFSKHQLSPRMFKWDTRKGQKQYNRLLTRAYSFYQELQRIDRDKPGFASRVKLLVGRALRNLFN